MKQGRGEERRGERNKYEDEGEGRDGTRKRRKGGERIRGT